MLATGQRRQPGGAVRATGLKVLRATLSAQRPAPPRLTICAEAVFASLIHVKGVHMWVKYQQMSRSTKLVAVASRLAPHDGSEHNQGKRLPGRPEIRVVCGPPFSATARSAARRYLSTLLLPNVA